MLCVCVFVFVSPCTEGRVRKRDPQCAHARRVGERGFFNACARMRTYTMLARSAHRDKNKNYVVKFEYVSKELHKLTDTVPVEKNNLLSTCKGPWYIAILIPQFVWLQVSELSWPWPPGTHPPLPLSYTSQWWWPHHRIWPIYSLCHCIAIDLDNYNVQNSRSSVTLVLNILTHQQ